MLNPGTKTSSPRRGNTLAVKLVQPLGGQQALQAWRPWVHTAASGALEKGQWVCVGGRGSTCEQRAPWRAVSAQAVHRFPSQIQQTPDAASLSHAAGFSAGLQPLTQVLGGRGPYLLFGFWADAQVFPDSMGSPLTQPAKQRPHSNDKDRVKQRPAGDGSAGREVLLPVTGTLSSSSYQGC